MGLQQQVMVRFFSCFNQNPVGLGRMLSLYLVSEERSEISPLKVLVRGLSDGPLKSLVKKHLADEGRHAGLLRARIRELGQEVTPLPTSLEPQEYYFQRNRGLADVLNLPPEAVQDPAQVIEILLFNSVLEEFALPRFLAHAEACRAQDPRTYMMLMDIAADEIRHTVYTQHYAYLLAGEHLQARTRARHAEMRAAQARYGAFMFRTLIEDVLGREGMGVSRLAFMSWRIVARQQERIGGLMVPWGVPEGCPETLQQQPMPWGMGAA